MVHTCTKVLYRYENWNELIPVVYDLYQFNILYWYHCIWIHSYKWEPVWRHTRMKLIPVLCKHPAPTLMTVRGSSVGLLSCVCNYHINTWIFKCCVYLSLTRCLVLWRSQQELCVFPSEAARFRYSDQNCHSRRERYFPEEKWLLD